ncbi:MAG: tRNA pseudouridine synthase A, partial [Deltaproteobacteria bacterium]|nr:tRNA pseudouridine synthase A [Deltaproteobacteria bacterium]
EVFLKGLNSLLPKDIVIKACEIVPEHFHARYSAESKTYVYRILNRHLPSAIGRQYAWHIRTPLDEQAMRQALGYIIGTHDFKAFEGAGSPRASTTRTVIEAKIFREDLDYLVIQITANGFLRFMARNIVGTLVHVGAGKLTPDDFKSILMSRNRRQAGATAPPHGLFLMKVEY